MRPSWFACGVSATSLTLAAWSLSVYPALPLLIGGILTAYAALLYRYPAAFLLAVPIALPAFDLGLWTGWMVVGEADLIVLVSIAILAIRVKLTKADLWPPIVPRIVLLLLVGTTVLTTITGLLTQATPSDNAFLRPDNALRLAKGLAEALALLPFIRQRQRVSGDALSLLAWGMAAGIGVVTLAVMAERALFAGVFDFTTDYRVAGPFSSMRVGGGHIGAYLALALPFLFACTGNRVAGACCSLRITGCVALLAVAGAYALIVTYARTGYLAGLAGIGVAGLAWLFIQRRSATGWARTILPLVLLGGLIAVIGVAASSTVMRQRVLLAAADLLTREDNWRAGWDQRDASIPGLILGRGLGTYQRVMRAQSTTHRPSDIVLDSDAEGRFVTLRTDSAFFLGQKIGLPTSGPLTLSLRVRSDGASRLGILLCDKVLLYSDQCRGPDAIPASAVWQTISVSVPTQGLGRSAWGGLIRRPVELSLFDTTKGGVLSIRDIRLTDANDAPALANGDFAQGLDRWLFTDDTHVAWRMLNQYLMILFESGVLGLAAFLALASAAIAGGVVAVRQGNALGAAVLGGVASFLVSGLFDNVLEAPRVATLFYLTCFAGLMLLEQRQDQ